MNGYHNPLEKKRVEVSFDHDVFGNWFREMDRWFRELTWSVNKLGKDKIEQPPIDKFFSYPLTGPYSIGEASILNQRLDREYNLYREMIDDYFALMFEQTKEELSRHGVLNSGFAVKAEAELQKRKERTVEILNYKKEHAIFEINRLSSPLLKVTIDTNVVIKFVDNEVYETAPRSIVTAYFSRKIDLVVTAAIAQDISKAGPDSKIKLFDLLKTIPEVTSNESPATQQLREKVEKIIFPKGAALTGRINKYLDTLHIALHILNKRNVFVTDDSGILKKKGELQSAFQGLTISDSVTAESIIAGRI